MNDKSGRFDALPFSCLQFQNSCIYLLTLIIDKKAQFVAEQCNIRIAE